MTMQKLMEGLTVVMRARMYDMLCDIDADYLDEGCSGCGTISAETAVRLRSLLDDIQGQA